MRECSASEAHREWTMGATAIIDVREQREHDVTRVAGVPLIPLSELAGRIGEIPSDRPVVVMCRSGQRSARVVEFLSEEGFPVEAINLEGGILAWAAAGLPYEGETPG